MSGRANLGRDLGGVATAVVDFVAFVFLGWLVASAYLAHVPPSPLAATGLPPGPTPGPPLWGWLLVLAGLALAFAVPLSTRVGSSRSVSSGVRVTMIVIPVSFCAQLVFSGARWSSLPGLVIAAGWCLCLIASIMTARATREPEAADAVGD